MEDEGKTVGDSMSDSKGDSLLWSDWRSGFVQIIPENGPLCLMTKGLVLWHELEELIVYNLTSKD